MKVGTLVYRVGRLVRASAGMGAAVSLAIVVGHGFFEDLRFVALPSADLLHVAALGLLLVLLARQIALQLDARPTRSRLLSSMGQLELGLLLVTALFVLLELTGGTRGSTYALVYVFIAYAVSFHSLPVGLTLLGATLALDAAATSDRLQFAEHAGFILLFAVLNKIFLRSEIWRGRRELRARIETEVEALRQEARDFRLISSALGAESRVRSREEEEEKLAQGAVESIHQSLFYTLELLKKSLELHTCVLLWLDSSGERLKIKELVTDSDLVVERDVPADAGAIGACIKDRLLINLRTPARGQVPYYRAPEEVGAFAAVPLLEGTHLRGVLAVDRMGPRSFDEKDEGLLQRAAGQVLRAIQSERVLTAIERSKYEKERFFRASEMLNQALTLEQVYDVALRAAREIAAFDFAAITLFSKETRRHTVCRVEGQGRPQLEGLTFSENAGLVSMAVKNRHYLPATGQVRGEEVTVFTKRVKVLRGYESLLVLPLVCADEAIGALTLAGRRRHLFSKDKRDMLGVITNQVAVSIENAKMYRLMEEMATTDGLTGLLNHRTFQERAGMMLERSERLGKTCTLILCDIDHFKSINDTHGHPMGDVVLRRVAQLLAATVRKIDLVARYGGEEFALVLEETDVIGARELAERIRSEISRQQFLSDRGPFRVTLSLGIAAYPADGKDKDTLIEHADRALYAAKHGGRNRSVLYTDLARSAA